MLNETEALVVQTIRMRLKGKESLAYLKANGKEITLEHYYRVKGKLDGEKLKRLHEIGQYGFVDQHLERIDNLELIQELLWKNYWVVHLNKPHVAVTILKEIRELQPYLSSYYEATKFVIENNDREKSINLPNI